MKRRVMAVLCVLTLVAGLCGCAAAPATEETQAVEETQAEVVEISADADIPKVVTNTLGYDKWDDKVDYSDTANWLNVPGKIDKDVDVIYYYPTCYATADSSVEVVADIDDEGMRTGAQAVYNDQATVFQDSCNIFAPYYRQLDGGYTLTLSAEDENELMRYAASKDGSDVLDYYFENYNNGRPFIIAGHSQGAELVIFLLADYFREHPDYYERMVAAYPIGWGVTEDILSENEHLKFAEGADDTGVIISWNTEGPENKGHMNVVAQEGSKSINPINWKTDDTYAPANENIGSVIGGEELQGIADAQIDLERGTLVTNADKQYAMPANDLFGPASFHGNDYGLYYNNIKENVQMRINAYLGVDEIADASVPTDYSDPDNWAKDDYNNPEKKDTAVDVIFFYGTAVSGDVVEDGIIQICDGMKNFVIPQYESSAGVFDDDTRIYIPYYRQLSLEKEMSCTDTLDCINTLENTVVGTDLRAALDYYFENYNEGRPFILSGYSQGGMAVQAMLDMYFGEEEHKAYLDNMVVAYSIGFGVDKEWLAERDYLKFSECADDTGVIASWNTEGPGEKGFNPLIPIKTENSLVINPINWKTDDTYASAEECLGSYGDEGIVTPGLYNLQIDPERGSMICDNNTDYVDDGTGEMWGGKSLHLYEIKEVYLSLRQNMHDRIDAFLKKDK